MKFLSIQGLSKSFAWWIFVLMAVCFAPMNLSGATKKTDNKDLYTKAQEAFFNYDFEEATSLFEQYKNKQTKAKKPIEEDFEIWQSRNNIAANAFNRVQKIVVIDSIAVPRASFFKAMKLAKSAGTIGLGNDFNLKNLDTGNELSYLSEDGVYFITPMLNSEDNLELIESLRLLDGTWESQKALQGNFHQSGDYAFPFLGGDGQTLYFANNGDDSMGGYDLFVAQKEPITGEALQPLNLGMPFNSPYDDLMIAIDEETGIGWWATDRNDPGGDITIYVYILDEARQNYPSDTENLAELAKLSDYKATWEEGKEKQYKRILNSIPK